MTLRPDDIGRDAIRRSDAQILLHEKRASELRAAKHRQLGEQEAVEQDRVKFASIWKGLAADDLPAGVSAGDAMLAAARQGRPRRQSPVEAALGGSPSMAYHAYPANPDEE